MMNQKRFSTLFLLLIGLLFILPSLALAEGDGFTIGIGEDLILPDDDFGLGEPNLESPKGVLTGQLSYLFQRTTGHEDSILNKDEILFSLPEKEYLFDLQLDYSYTIQDDSRIFVSTNLLEQKTEGKGFLFEIDLREAFVSHGLDQYGNLILGKQKLNFGNGFGWTPTGIYATSQIKDGVVSGRWSIPVERFTLTTVLIPPLADQRIAKGQLYERVETTYGQLSLAVSGAVLEKEDPRFGLDFSTFIGDVEVYGAFSGKQENSRRYLKEQTMPNPFGDELKGYEYETRDDQDWYLQGLLGSTYTIPGTETFLIVEYFHDSTGLTEEEMIAVGDAAEYCQEQMEDEQLQRFGLDAQYRGYLGELNDYFRPGQMGQNYLFLGVRNLNLWNGLTSNLYGIVNGEDQSGVFTPELKYSLTENTNLILNGNLFFGAEKTEYGMSVIEHKIGFKTETLF